MSANTLPRSGILAFLDEESLQTFSSYGNWVNTSPGEILIAEGVANQRLYVILKGTFSVTTVVQEREVDFDKLNAGDCIGEVAIFNPDLASATVTSIVYGELWSIDSQQLQQFLNEHPAAGCAAVMGIATILSRRLRRADDVIRTNEIVPIFLSVRAKRGTRSLPHPRK